MALKKFKLVIQTQGLIFNGALMEASTIELPLRAENLQDAQVRAQARIDNFKQRGGLDTVQFSVVEVAQ